MLLENNSKTTKMIHKNNFHLIRLVAALMVIIGHAYSITGLPGMPIVLGMGIHTLGVKIFFVTSGYLIVESYLRDPNFFRFMLRRILRLFPGLVLVVLFSTVVLGPFATSLNLAEYFSNTFLYIYLGNIALYINFSLPGVFENNPIKFAVNGSLWTLPVEFFCYVLLGIFLYVIHIKYLPYILILISIALISWLYFLDHREPQKLFVFYATDWKSGSRLIVYFLIGSVIRLFSIGEKITTQHFIIVLMIFLSIPNAFFINNLAPLLLLPLGTFSFAFSKPISGWLNGQDISYGIYLWAFPMGQLLLDKQIATTPIFSIILTTLLILPIAYLSWQLVEKPALRLKPG